MSTNVFAIDLTAGVAAEHRVADALAADGCTVHPMADGAEPRCDLMAVRDGHGRSADAWRRAGWVPLQGGSVAALVEVKACPDAAAHGAVPVELQSRGADSGIITSLASIWVFALPAALWAIPADRLRDVVYCREGRLTRHGNAICVRVPMSAIIPFAYVIPENN